MALCLAGRDIAADLPEWINWHHLLGVDRFYVFDLGTRKPMNKVHMSVDSETPSLFHGFRFGWISS